jgi:CRP-like cAMP-binding protein
MLHGKAHIGLLRPDDLFGFEAALGKQKYEFSVVAIEHGTEILKVLR